VSIVAVEGSVAVVVVVVVVVVVDVDGGGVAVAVAAVGMIDGGERAFKTTSSADQPSPVC